MLSKDFDGRITMEVLGKLRRIARQEYGSDLNHDVARIVRVSLSAVSYWQKQAAKGEPAYEKSSIPKINALFSDSAASEFDGISKEREKAPYPHFSDCKDIVGNYMDQELFELMEYVTWIYNESFGQRRENHNLKEVADLFEVSYATVCKWKKSRWPNSSVKLNCVMQQKINKGLALHCYFIARLFCNAAEMRPLELKDLMEIQFIKTVELWKQATQNERDEVRDCIDKATEQVNEEERLRKIKKTKAMMLRLGLTIEDLK